MYGQFIIPFFLVDITGCLQLEFICNVLDLFHYHNLLKYKILNGNVGFWVDTTGLNHPLAYYISYGFHTPIPNLCSTIVITKLNEEL